MNNWTPLRTLSDSELAAKAHTELDTLTSTSLEIELIRMLEELSDQQAKVDEADDFLSSVNEDDFDAISATFADHNIDNIKVLREKLERADKFYDIAAEGGEAFSMLAKLAETSQ